MCKRQVESVALTALTLTKLVKLPLTIPRLNQSKTKSSLDVIA